MNSDAGCYNKFFSHVYVEKGALEYPDTSAILGRLPYAEVVCIDHYKDVFNRSHQDAIAQKRSPAMILAVNSGELVYRGAPVCQSFGQREFYYTASSMNCSFDCEYCFLKGMYNTSNIVCFVNLEDYEREIKKLSNPYVCVSYDTDLIGLNSLTGQADRWVEFASENPEILIEMRTKAAPAKLTPLPNLIYAFTLSPDEIASRFEKNVPPLRARLKAVENAIRDGCTVRLCFDPMIYVEGWKDIYTGLVDQVADRIELGKVKDISVGTFRISSEYLKKMRKQMPRSEVCWFPFTNAGGYASYPEELDNEMMDHMCSVIGKYVDEGRIFTWR
ncbi:MAG: radical SAM protein [Clostridiales bacterium]|nr:radical SAM protein [Clostridiales bacterium]